MNSRTLRQRRLVLNKISPFGKDYSRMIRKLCRKFLTWNSGPILILIGLSVSLLLSSGCGVGGYPDVNGDQLIYGDKVVVTEGFYTGLTGKVCASKDNCRIKIDHDGGYLTIRSDKTEKVPQ